MGDLKEPPARVSKRSESSCSGDDEAEVRPLQLPGHFSEVLEGMGGGKGVAVYILFEVRVKARISFFWKAMLFEKKLYVDILNINLSSCSKQR